MLLSICFTKVSEGLLVVMFTVKMFFYILFKQGELDYCPNTWLPVVWLKTFFTFDCTISFLLASVNPTKPQLLTPAPAEAGVQDPLGYSQHRLPPLVSLEKCTLRPVGYLVPPSLSVAWGFFSQLGI